MRLATSTDFGLRVLMRLAAAPGAADAKTVIKLASLFPDGAPGTEMLHDAAKRIESLGSHA